MPAPRVTLRDVARAAGVSAGTASEALRGHAWVKPDKRAQVLAAAERLGYQRDPVISSFAAERFRNATRFRGDIVVLCNKADGPGFAALAKRLRAAGYAPLPCVLHPKLELSRQAARWNESGVRGVVLLLCPHDRRLFQIDWGKLSGIQIHTSLPVPLFNQVSGDAIAAFKETLLLALARGYRRIGVVLHTHDWPFIEDQVRDGLLGVLEKKYPDVRFFRLHERFRRAFDEQVANLAAWVGACQPEVVVAHTVGSYALDHAGLPLPRLCLDAPLDSPFEGSTRDIELICQTAVDLLDGMIRRRELGLPRAPMRTLVPHLWRLRDAAGDWTLSPQPPLQAEV